MSDSLPLYYQGVSLPEMESRFRDGYLTSSGWLESAKTKLSVRNGKPRPWFTYSAIAFLERELAAGLSLFEYSGGQSTLYWAERLKQVVSIDHDPAFIEHVRSDLPENASMHLVEEGAANSETYSRLASRRGQRFWSSSMRMWSRGITRNYRRSNRDAFAF